MVIGGTAEGTPGKEKNEVQDRSSVSDWNCDRAVVGMRRNRGSVGRSPFMPDYDLERSEVF
jgi:hypothetical protein